MKTAKTLAKVTALRLKSNLVAASAPVGLALIAAIDSLSPDRAQSGLSGPLTALEQQLAEVFPNLFEESEQHNILLIPDSGRVI